MTSKVKSFERFLKNTEGLTDVELMGAVSQLRATIPDIDRWRLPFELSYLLIDAIPEDFSTLYIPPSQLNPELIKRRRYLYLTIKPGKALELTADIKKFKDDDFDYGIEIKRQLLLDVTFVEDLSTD